MSDLVRYSLVIAVAGLFAAEGSQASDGKSLITSWNVCSKQFIDAPGFKLLPIPEANCYRAEVAQGETKWADQALGLFGFCFGTTQRREQHAGEDRNGGDDDEEFDQGEPLLPG